MKAYVTSIGEPTTELCIWSLERQGFEVELYQDKTTLADKLARIYLDAEDDFLRVDADTIVNQNVKRIGEYESDAWWIQPQTFDWYKQDLAHGGVQLIRKEALSMLRTNIGLHMGAIRPESNMFRLPEFHNPRRCVSSDLVVGLHGYGQTDIRRVKDLKAARNQMHNYDFELAERLSIL